MDDNTPETTEATEVVADTGKVGVSLRETLQSRFVAEDEAAKVAPSTPEQAAQITKVDAKADAQETPTAAPVQERVAIAPPADMRKEEREAFLNPTAENAHILQGYLSRRGLETQRYFQQKTTELEQARQRAASLADVVSKYEPEYAKYGMNIADVTRRSLEWDRAMQANPRQAALEWLDAYGLSVEDLVEHAQNGGVLPQQEQPKYLTAQQAEEIAQAKIDALLQQQQQSVLAQQNYQAVQSFIATKPLFKDPGTASQLEEAMAPIVAALSGNGQSPQEILETAYTYVTKGNPTFAALASKLEAPQVVEQKTREAEKAKRATKSISGSAGSGNPRLQTKDLRSNLQRRFYGGD